MKRLLLHFVVDSVATDQKPFAVFFFVFYSFTVFIIKYACDHDLIVLKRVFLNTILYDRASCNFVMEIVCNSNK